MKIPITKHQHDLLNKRNAASQEALMASKSATLVAQRERAAFDDVLSYMSVSAGVPPDTQFEGIQFGADDDGKYFLELIERVK